MRKWTRVGPFLRRRGPAFVEGEVHGGRKLCFSATDVQILHGVLDRIAGLDACWAVKRDREPRAGMYRGRAALNDDELTGWLWRAYRSHPSLLCSIQDDSFAAAFRGGDRGDCLDRLAAVGLVDEDLEATR